MGTITRKMSRNIFAILSTVVVCAFILLPSGSAAILEFDSTYLISGTAPTTPAPPAVPWLTATFQDIAPINGINAVSLTLSVSSALPAGQFVSGWYFNFGFPGTLPSGNQFAPSLGNPTTASIATETDGFKADGDGYHDILFSFSTANNDASRFTPGETALFILTGPNVTARSFKYLSTSSWEGAFYTATHIQGMAGDNSGWVGSAQVGVVPIPTPLLLLSAGLLGLVAIRRRRKVNSLRSEAIFPQSFTRPSSERQRSSFIHPSLLIRAEGGRPSSQSRSA